MFEENRGQFPATAKYLTRRNGYKVAFASGFAEILAAPARPVRLLFPKALEPQGIDRLNTKLNYFHGSDPREWVQGAAAYTKVAYESPGGTSLLFYWNHAGNLEFDLTLPPGQTADTFGLRLEGQTGAHLSSSGDLKIEAEGTVLTLRKPTVYQVDAGVRRLVECDYILQDGGLVGFRLGSHNSSLAVTIDPTLTVTAGTYLGGSIADNGRAVAVDSSGNTYIAGDTQSTDFPVSSSPLQGSLNGTQDAFIAKLNPSGSAVLFATFLGGSAGDIATGIGVDGTGNIYVAGTTYSNDFPTKNAAIGTFPTISGQATGWVAKMNPAGSSLLYSTFLGGSGSDAVDGLAVDSAGNAYVTGGTRSVNFPVVNGYQTVSENPGGGFDQAFLTKLSTTGAITYSTITNAFGADGVAVATNNSGVAVFVSTALNADAPVKNAFQALPGGLQDAYVAKVDTTQSGANSLLFATFLGGSALEQPKGIALDASGNVYVDGTTQSTNFPIKNAYQNTLNGFSNGFLTKLASSGSSLIFSTYFAGAGTGLATDASGNVYMTGLTGSTLPLLNALPDQSQPGFVTAFSFSGTLIYSTYVGTGGISNMQAIAASGSGDVTVAGQAGSGIPVTANAAQPTALSANAFILRLQFAQPAVLTTTSVTPQQGGDSGFTTVAVRGVNILSGASLSLHSVSTTITAFSTVVAADGRGITGTFDLRHQPDGAYDVVVTNPDSTTSTLGGAFAVVLGGAPQIYVTTVGLSKIRSGGSGTVTVIVGNNGTADAFAVPVTAQYPANTGFTLTVNATLLTPPQNPNLPTIDYSQVPVTASDGTTIFVPLIVPWIPAGGTSYFRITLSSPPTAEIGPTTMSVSVGPPYLMVDPNGSQISGLATRSRLLSAGLHPNATGGQLVQQFVLTPDGRVCLLNIFNLIIKLAGLVPGVDCGQDILQQLLGQTLSTMAVTALQGALNNGSLSAGDLQSAAAQNDLSALELLLDCAGAPARALNFVKDIQLALTLVGTIDSCTKFIVKDIIPIVGSADPNEKDGPTGAGTQQWISGVTPVPYAIQFENLPAASAPAGQVVVTDRLNPQLFNLSTFSFGTIGFGSTAVTPLPGSTSYSTKVDLRPGKNTVVAVNANLDNTGLITWTFQSQDPISGLPVQDPDLGFLPPNVVPPQGQGFVNFSVALNPGLSTGTVVPNQANVVFDSNPAILTNVWQNTIDASSPTSAVVSLPANEPGNVFTVNWSGSDQGSGVRSFTIFQSVNGGPFTPWISNTTSTSGVCQAAPNSTQSFFSIATDQAGNVESGKILAEALTHVTNTESIVIATNPAGLLVSVDNGAAQTSPVSVTWQVGSQHNIATSTPQTYNGTPYNWTNWSDLGAISHPVTASVGVPSYTATFAPAPAPSLGSSISAKSGPSNARVWGVALTNGGAGTALAARLLTFQLNQTFGTSCTPHVATPMPESVGDIAPGVTGTANVTIDFSSCAATARFTVTYSYGASNEAAASKTFLNQFQ